VLAVMHDDEVPTSVELVRRLVEDQLPQWAALDVRPVASSGTDNALFRLGTDLVVRLPRIGWAVEDVTKEQTWLPRLAPHLPVPVPAPVALGRPGHGYPWRWSVYRWLDLGTNPAVGALEDPVGLAQDLAAFVRALRAVDPTGGPEASRGGLLAERDEQTRECAAAVADEYPTGLLLEMWEDALAAPPWAGDPVWLHGDLTAGNLLVRGGRLTAVIDFGCLGTGEPAIDLLPAWNLLPPDARAAFGEAVGADEDTWRRSRGWALSVALIALPYYRKRNPSLAAASRHVVEELLATR
jgi:aminoglycoside phosphotransferase (APT) family kinase protein